MNLAHRIQLDPTHVQANYFARACGVARFAWNWGLAEWKRQYTSGEKPNEAELRKKLNAIKAVEFPWMYEVTKCAPQQAIKNLGQAFKHFFKGLRTSTKRSRYPRFKKKGLARDSFYLDNINFEIDGRRIKLPHVGWVRTKEELRFSGKIQSATISRTADRWFVSVQVEVPDIAFHLETQETVGVDLGCSTFMMPSRGEPIQSPKPHKTLLNRVRRLSRRLSKKTKGSSNRKKAAMKLACLHARIANMRKDATHKATTYLATTFAKIVIEDLNVSGMMKNHRLARSIADMAFYETRRQLEYKTKRYGSELVVADRFFPSSKTCSNCGHVYADLKLSEREWICDACGVVHDRDKNAALNLERYTGSSPAKACGVGSSDSSRKSRVKLPTMKQELSTSAMSAFGRN